MTSLATLTDRALLAVSGSDSQDFLQGLITNDVRDVATGAGLYAALLTPQGKVLYDFFVSAGPDGVLLDCAAEAAEGFHKRLSLYRLRAKVDIIRRDDLAVLAQWGGDSPAASWWPDPRMPDLGWRTVVENGGIPSAALPSSAYLDHRLGLGVPESADFGQDRMFALDAGLEELHGVSFDKGCYVGQELTARMKHRATARKRLLPIDTSSDRLPDPGTVIMAGAGEIGSLTSAYGRRGFALIRIDRLDDASGAQLMAGGTPVRIVKPHWLFA